MQRIGLTGGIGSGKTTVSDLFQSLGAVVIDADEISHQITQPGEPATRLIKQQWGQEVFTETGQLNRVALRNKVFSDPSQLEILESILHPAIELQILKQTEQLREQGESYCLIVIPLLFEKGLAHLVNKVIVVDIPVELQIERVMQRDQVSEAHVRRILQQQITRTKRLELADYVIHNSDNKTALVEQIKKLHQHFSEQ